jgi:hypothetical protein
LFFPFNFKKQEIEELKKGTWEIVKNLS